MSQKPSRTLRKSWSGLASPKPARTDFWEEKDLEQLAAEQGVRPIERLEEVLGQGADLWRDDAALESFLAVLREHRRKGA